MYEEEEEGENMCVGGGGREGENMCVGGGGGGGGREHMCRRKRRERTYV